MRIPEFKEPGLTKALEDLQVEIDRKLKGKLAANSGVHGVLLVSPSRKVYQLTVEDDGSLTTTAVAE